MKSNRFWESGKTALLGTFCALCLPCFSLAQQTRVRVDPPEQVTLKRGGSVTQSLDVTVIPGFHVNGDKPKDEFLIPLKLTWSSGPVEVKSISYPQPEEIQVGTEKLLVLTGNFKINTDFKAPANAPSGPSTLTGKLRYQACNTQMCFRPATIDITLPVVVQ